MSSSKSASHHLKSIRQELLKKTLIRNSFIMSSATTKMSLVVLSYVHSLAEMLIDFFNKNNLENELISQFHESVEKFIKNNQLPIFATNHSIKAEDVDEIKTNLRTNVAAALDTINSMEQLSSAEETLQNQLSTFLNEMYNDQKCNNSPASVPSDGESCVPTNSPVSSSEDAI